MTEPAPVPEAANRRHNSMRLKDYDYSQAGAYFVTVCIQDRLCLFGDVVDEEMLLSAAGRSIEYWWLKLPSKFASVAIDQYVVMPNHFHGIIVLSQDSAVGAAPRGRPVEQHDRVALPTVMDWFKTMTTNEYMRGVRQGGWQPFAGRLWQRGYYEHIVRSEASLDRIREYIYMNPQTWRLDKDNPQWDGVSDFCATL